MSDYYPTREEAVALFKKYNSSDSLYRHALSVEGVMRHQARKNGEDEDVWGIIGLIHDLDYEAYPDQHCKKTEEILRQENWPEEYIRAVLSHGYGIVTDIEPLSLMEKTLYAMDELTGLVATSALVRPTKSVLDMGVKSVKKKWNDKRFAAGVDRSVIEDGAARLGVTLEELIEDCIMGMREVADEIGLRGSV
ncbi:MAG: HDIG domain-containing protein [Bacteroidales bacterium]